MTEVIGKRVAARQYVHTSLCGSLDTATSDLVALASGIAGVRPDTDYNVIRLDSLSNSVALLCYPRFFDEACPSLTHSWKVSINDRRATLRNYLDSLNPPVLHRKELLLGDGDSRRPPFEQLTAELEALGLFDDPVRIGFKLQWEQLLRERGFRLVGHQLAPIGNAEPPEEQGSSPSPSITIARHLTALSRKNFSAPIQLLQRFGYLDGSRTVFDYGCGKGDDLRSLVENGIRAAGWDPHFAPAAAVLPAGIVNLGFVINVIEDPAERREALRRAFSLAEEVLVVSVMIATDNPGKFTFYGDGVLTSRTTFQKYYTQTELRAYLTEALDEVPISVAPGIFLIFRDKQAEQSFQAGRQRGTLRIRPLVQPHAITGQSERFKRLRATDRYEVHRPMLTRLWGTWLDLGREPLPAEVPELSMIEQELGSLKRALRLAYSHNNVTELRRARTQRIDDLRVYLALQQFQRRKPYRTLEARLQNDIRSFFGDYKSAVQHATDLLMQVAKPEVLHECCSTAFEQGLGWIEPGHSLQFHASLVPRLPAPLRTYVGCAGVLYGEVEEADLVKIHIRSGKTSFMKYDDFFGKALPRMTERVKINLRTLNFQLFTYGEDFPSPLLYFKSRYINEELPHYAEQLAFDEALQALSIDLAGYGPSELEFEAALASVRHRINGFMLERLHSLPDLDECCGRFLTYRQLIECGDTQAVSGLSNLPTSLESYTALLDLATSLLDPVIEYYGAIKLTYGFCSSALARRIRGRIAPELDQHAAHDRNRRGAPICPRLGAAVDFFVQDEDMREVAQWIIANLPFDRLYFYGNDRPIHVSYKKKGERQAFEMRAESPSGKRIPRPFKPEE